MAVGLRVDKPADQCTPCPKLTNSVDDDVDHFV